MSGEFSETIAREAEKAEWRNRLNSAFKEGRSIYDPEIIETVRRAEFPILVDYNNVLFGNNENLGINPEAKDFLATLKQIGEIFVVTTATNWEKIWKRLEDNGLNGSVVLLVIKNYFVPDEEKGKNYKKQIDAYIDKIHGLGLAEEFGLLDQTDRWAEYQTTPTKGQRLYFSGSASRKRIAPAFGKTFRIPIVDDDTAATVGNPGIIGFTARYFEDDPRDFDLVAIERSQAKYPPLSEIAKQITEYKNSLQATGKI